MTDIPDDVMHKARMLAACTDHQQQVLRIALAIMAEREKYTSEIETLKSEFAAVKAALDIIVLVSKGRLPRREPSERDSHEGD